MAHTLLTLLGAASEKSGLDRYLKVNTVKRRTHSLYRQGVYWYDCIPTCARTGCGDSWTLTKRSCAGTSFSAFSSLTLDQRKNEGMRQLLALIGYRFLFPAIVKLDDDGKLDRNFAQGGTMNEKSGGDSGSLQGGRVSPDGKQLQLFGNGSDGSFFKAPSPRTYVLSVWL